MTNEAAFRCTEMYSTEFKRSAMCCGMSGGTAAVAARSHGLGGGVGGGLGPGGLLPDDLCGGV